MILIPRALARQFRAVLRRSIMDQESRGGWPAVLCRTDPEGLWLFSQQGEIGVCFHAPGNHPAAALAFSASELEHFEGRSDDPVRLEPTDNSRAKATWQEGPLPRQLEFATLDPDKTVDWPRARPKWESIPPAFLQAFDDASAIAVKDTARYALYRVQLRGKSGQIIASDSKQLLVQSGFGFPWSDDMLVPRVRALGMLDVPDDATPQIARTVEHLWIRCGPWTFVLTIDTTSRYPNVQAVIPKPAAMTCRLSIDPLDADFLIRNLPKLPGAADDGAPVTLDLQARPKVRAQAKESSTVTEIELSRSSIDGKPQCNCLDRTFLMRALKLGLNEIHVANPDKPLVCRDKKRLLLVVTLGPSWIVPSNRDAIRVTSASDDVSVPEPSDTIPERRTPMPPPNSNHHSDHELNGNGSASERGPGIPDMIGEAEQLKTSAQDLAARLARLINGLKQHRKQGKAMEAAMNSLRQLRLGD